MKSRLFASACLLLALACASLSVAQAQQTASGDTKKLVIIAGKPSHPARMHEFNAGTQLLVQCLANTPGLKVEYSLNGWPKDESTLDDADAIVFYMDGGPGHEVVKEDGRRLAIVDKLAKKGVGLGFMHYGVEVVSDQAGKEFMQWIGGHYEAMFSCNPMWEPTFSQFPDHPITRGVHPFTINDEWYMNMRFAKNIVGNEPAQIDDMKFTPILVAAPADDVRAGPYVHPKGPYDHIIANKGRAEAMMWAVERADGGRGYGFTGGHYHDNWGNDDFRKVVLNAMLWITKIDVPENGVASTVTKEQLDQNLDPKKK